MDQPTTHKKYHVTLTDDEQHAPGPAVGGQGPGLTLTHGKYLASPCRMRATVARPGATKPSVRRLISVSTVARARQRFVEEGFWRPPWSGTKPRRIYSHLVDGECEAHLVALACSAPPMGHQRWTPRLLADQLVACEYIDNISHETVRQVLKTNLALVKKEWCIPPLPMPNSCTTWKMCWICIRGLRGGAYPLVCFDETSKQLIGETRRPLPAEPGQPERYDYEYVRNGVANLFMFFAPLHNWRYCCRLNTAPSRTGPTACATSSMSTFPDAVRVWPVEDNLNTHDPAALYEVFEPAEAKRILDRLEFHYTPKHGSWLNMAEIELSVLSGQCLDQRILQPAPPQQEVAAWEVDCTLLPQPSTGVSRRLMSTSSSDFTRQLEP